MKLSFGPTVIFILASVSAGIVALIPSEAPKGISFGIRYDAYLEPVTRWNEAHPKEHFSLSLFHDLAIERRMMSGFLTGAPMSDLLETGENMYAKACLGPIEQVGFGDLTDRIHEEGLYEQFNEASLIQQSHSGRLFGLPLFSGPVLLEYRSDLSEAAGISEAEINQVETWDDYFRVMRPLIQDLDGDGRPDRYLLGLSENNHDVIRMLVLQNDGVLFEESGQPSFANERNARTLATLTTWVTGPDPISVDVPLWNAAGHKQRLDGVVTGTLISGWMLAHWKLENPQLAGKIKLIPVPTFERGGRRTSSFGNCMLSINKRSEHIDACWEMAKRLYTSREVAELIYRDAGMVTAYKAHWEAPFYHEPDPFCGGQQTGTLFIEQAPQIPRTPASPYKTLAYAKLSQVMIALRAYADKHDIYDIDRLKNEALRLLQKEQTQLQKLINRNVFLTGRS